MSESTFCGPLFDGCETTLNCGVCPAAQTCAREGPVTLCVSADAAPDLAWSRTQLGTSVAALATDSRENIVVMADTAQGAAPMKFDPRGGQLWARSGFSPVPRFSGLSVTPSGELLAWGGRVDTDLGGGIAYRFDATGDSPRLLFECLDACALGPYHEDARGYLLASEKNSHQAGIRYGPAEAGGWRIQHNWDVPNQENTVSFYPATFDTDGAVLATGFIGGQGTFQGQSFGTADLNSGVVAKLSSEGRLLWSREFTQTKVSFFGAVGSGFYAVAGVFRGSLRWDGGELRAARPELDTPFLLVLDARGQVSWAQTLPLPPEHVALSTSGRIAIASEVSEPRTRKRHSLHLREYDLQGHLRWSHTWVPLEDRGAVVLHGLAWSEDAWVLGGSSTGIVPFNSSAEWVPPGAQGFVLKLQPSR